jgi:hypothetical protein
VLADVLSLISRGDADDAAIQAAMPPVIAAITSRLLTMLRVFRQEMDKTVAVHADFMVLFMYDTHVTCLRMYSTWIANDEALALFRAY